MSDFLGKHVSSSVARSVLVVACSSLGLYNALELLILIFTTFKHYSGLYFWSLLVASFGIIPYVLGNMIIYFSLAHNWIGFIIVSYGWCTMVTGQSVVLYSRLHLVLKSPNILRAVKWMIIVDAILFHVSTTVVLFGSKLGNDEVMFGKAYDVIEKIQMTGFCIQEFIISGLYVWKTVELLQVVRKPGTKILMWHLFIINIIIIAMDIAMLATEYRNLRQLQQAFKAAIYSIKLKLEFSILGQLVQIVQQSGHHNSSTFSDTAEYVHETNASVDLIKSPLSAQRTNSSAKPLWQGQFEKNNNPFQHIESVRHTRQESKGVSQVKETEVDTPRVPSMPDSITRLPQPARLRSESDLMYAEMMRSMSTPSK